MRKLSKFLLIFYVLFSLNTASLFAVEETEPNTAPALEDFLINISPNPVSTKSDFQIIIRGQGYGDIIVQFLQENKQKGKAEYNVAQNKITSNNTTAMIGSYTESPPVSTNSYWKLTLNAKGDKFDPGKIYVVRVINANTDLQTERVLTTLPDRSANATPNSICKLEDGICKKVNTGLGEIDPDPLSVISIVLRYLIGISGGLFLLIFIRAGYRMITSQGNPEAIKEARESIISAIVGFLFLLFSFIVLEIIGVDLFQLPGFNP